MTAPRPSLRVLLLGLLLLAPGWAWAQVPVPVPVRVASFPGYGRIVFAFPRPTDFQVTETENGAQVVFAGSPALGLAKGPPRNV